MEETTLSLVKQKIAEKYDCLDWENLFLNSNMRSEGVPKNAAIWNELAEEYAALRSKQQWISIHDALPETNIPVLVCCADTTEYAVAERDLFGWFISGKHEPINQPAYWMAITPPNNNP